MTGTDISAIIITKNEKDNISQCLASLSWLGEVVVVDSHSTDGTPEIIRQFPNTVLITSEWLGFSPTKRLAVQYSTNDWILWIDADEVLTQELRDEILALSSRNFSDYDAFDMPRKTYFLGEWVQHTGWYPGRVTRLFHRQKADFNDNILHEGIELQDKSRLGHLKHDLLHFSYKTLFQYFDKMNKYGLYGAEELKRRGKTFSFGNLILNPVATFFKFYISNKGYLDGTKGFIISVGSAFSNFIKYVNFYYVTKKKSN